VKIRQVSRGIISLMQNPKQNCCCHRYCIEECGQISFRVFRVFRG
jgi:hypothetical protein